MDSGKTDAQCTSSPFSRAKMKEFIRYSALETGSRDGGLGVSPSGDGGVF
jgi:hypothetical protein